MAGRRTTRLLGQPSKKGGPSKSHTPIYRILPLSGYHDSDEELGEELIFDYVSGAPCLQIAKVRLHAPVDIASILRLSQQLEPPKLQL